MIWYDTISLARNQAVMAFSNVKAQRKLSKFRIMSLCGSEVIVRNSCPCLSMKVTGLNKVIGLQNMKLYEHCLHSLPSLAPNDGQSSKPRV